MAQRRAFCFAMSAEIAISPASPFTKGQAETKHIGGLVFAAKAPVQCAQFAAAGHQHIDRALAA